MVRQESRVDVLCERVSTQIEDLDGLCCRIASDRVVWVAVAMGRAAMIRAETPWDVKVGPGQTGSFARFGVGPRIGGEAIHPCKTGGGGDERK